MTENTAGIVVAFDLDLTLADTRAATAFALEEVNRVLQVRVDVAEFVKRLGPPIRDELARWVPPGKLDDAVAVFRDIFTTAGLAHMRPLPGAAEAFDWLALSGGKAAVVTSRRPKIAQAILSSIALSPDFVYGGLTGTGKSPAITAVEAIAYVGDHPLDIAAARGADVTAIGVTSGNHDRDELLAVGADVVIDTLIELPTALNGLGAIAHPKLPETEQPGD